MTSVPRANPSVSILKQCQTRRGEAKHFIKSQRGAVLVQDRTGLIHLCQGTYGPAEIEYERLTGIPLGKSKPVPNDAAPLIRPA
ncbi:hypothetical protein [Rhizobium sp. WYCCWR 11152]|uniref:hypothetical protein n=1 Tax=Rhizobium sp. WYCCWR 11152 TaxID=2692316 RepID=UPI001AEE4203|nr:hypothetical protein [Rhizobium sp. WYCCWR 11152]